MHGVITRQPGTGRPGSWVPQETQGCLMKAEDDSDIHIRPITPADAGFAARAAIEGLRQISERNVGKRNMEGLIQAETETYRQMEPERCENLLIAEHGGKRAGIVKLRFRGERAHEGRVSDYCRHVGCCATIGLTRFLLWSPAIPAKHCLLDLLCVDPQFRGWGIGKALLDYADNRARGLGSQTIYVWVSHGNRARNLYERQGYVETQDLDGCYTWCATGIRRWYRMEKRL